tara:strand:+ start:3945 stop:5339 length:1395 start_codon:yes stop_codon:yes gene_type:complete
MVAVTVVPFVLYITSTILDRYVPDATTQERVGVTTAVSVSAFVGLLVLVFSCLAKFPRSGREMHPMWASPRLVLFLELHPIVGYMIPITSFLRGYVRFALVRWALNTVAIVLWLWGRGVLQPAYEEACCFGKNSLSGDEVGTCSDSDITRRTSFGICNPDFISDQHNVFLFVATIAFTISGVMQLGNVLTIDWDVLSRVGAIQAEMERRYESIVAGTGYTLNHTQSLILPPIDKNPLSDRTIDIRVVFERLGMDTRLMKIAFPDWEEPTGESWGERIHHHPQWAHSGLFRLLCLDPIFGFALSAHDFLCHKDNLGILRLLCNILGTTFVILSAEVLQPLHRAWCCYGEDHEIWDEHIGDKHRTCEEWAMAGRMDVFTDTATGPFRNGSCMHYLGTGELAFFTFAVGIALLTISIATWMLTFSTSGHACQRITRRFFRSVLPDERVLLLQVYDWLGVEHGKLKFV